MKTRIQNQVKLFAAILSLSFLPSLYTLAENPEGSFQFLKEKNGIDLYYRWLTMPEGNQVRQMKAVLEFNGTAEDVLYLLKDENKALSWIPSAEQFRNLTQISGPDWRSYIQFSVPWPFADQDCILEYTTRKDKDGSTVITFRTDEDYLSPVDGMGRMKDIVGSFVIHSRPDGKCTLECYFLSTKASKIPKWITEPIVTGSLLSLVEALRNELV
jgi:hypothetical protein